MRQTGMVSHPLSQVLLLEYFRRSLVQADWVILALRGGKTALVDLH